MPQNRYGGQWVQSLPSTTAHSVAVEGSYLICTNPTIGTGQTWVAAQTAFSDTAPNWYIFNNEPAGSGRSLCLHYLKMITTQASTGATAWHYAAILDTVARAFGTDNTQAITPTSPNGNTFLPVPTSLTVKVQNNASASVLAASSGNKRIVARGTLGGLVIAGDVMMIGFGDAGVGAQTATTAAEGAGQPGRRVDNTSPIIIGPQQSLALHLWAPSSSASINPEWELGMWFR